MTDQNREAGRLIGYARVSTGGQELHSQIDALKKAGVPEKLIFIDKASGAKSERPGLDSCMQELQAGDTLIIWRLDRLGRSLKHLIETVERLMERGVGFRSISDGGIDTTTASGEMVFNIFATLAQFERRLIQERTQAGLKAARARGRKGGRPKISPNDPKVKMAKKLSKNYNIGIGEICNTLKISRATYYRFLKIGE
ncbi:recombinase family protein [Prosthecochloris sp. HL-130-GSB]|uniref:recombinase family protein n=1 Tax=Prosthecochloris sp. HL-130-GSB TaxID=1974213 RepID=UPI000A1C1201|nr:recombinase family protein [Prosthecochloris sp. HL-130-GSB]ARM30950.1 invertase [Prosthecochloris sp. HL-130-GSB]